MISKETANEVTSTINQWCESMDIDKKDVVELLERLANVRGNQSYRMSIRALVLMLKDRQQLEEVNKKVAAYRFDDKNPEGSCSHCDKPMVEWLMGQAFCKFHADQFRKLHRMFNSQLG